MSNDGSPPPQAPPNIALPLAEDVGRVHYRFFCEDLTETFLVADFELVEELDRPFRMTVRLTAEDEVADGRQLLGRDVSVMLERHEQSRVFYGIVQRVTVGDSVQARQECTVEIVPALAALALTKTSRIFQDKTALEIVVEVLEAELAPYRRSVDAAQLDAETYETRDYCVQYQETSLDFVHRLLEEEGIGYAFTHGLDGPEQVVLFDRNGHMPAADTLRGPVPFDATFREWANDEPVVRFVPSVALASSAVTVRDHDWMRSRSRVEASAEADPAAMGPVAQRHEVYEHGLARNLTLHEDAQGLGTLVAMAQTAAIPSGLPGHLDRAVLGLDGALLDNCSENDATHQASIRRELQDRDRAVVEGVGLVMGFSPGRTFTLTGHPAADADGAYYVSRVVHSSRPRDAALEGAAPVVPEGTNYQNRFECRPTRAAWRPTRATPKPQIASVQTAKVTGPMGMDVHTDGRGRILVQFPWDRADPKPSGAYTCWIRVSQAWAGQGFPGFMFIPRVGMEVVVAFVDGDPDRPLVTGCVYNGENPTPNLLPVQATKSILRTRTVPHGPGHNELSFEDAMGIERVHLRAERDLDELIQHDHVTKVKRNQANVVEHDQLVAVLGNRKVHVEGDQTRHVVGRQADFCSGDQRLVTEGSRSVTVNGSYRLSVPESSLFVGAGTEMVLNAERHIVLAQGDERFIEVAPDGPNTGILIESKGATIHVGDDKIEMIVGQSKILIVDDRIQINGKTFPSSGS